MRVSARPRDTTQALARLPEVREDRRLNEFRQKHEEGPQPLAHGMVGRAPVDEKLKDPVREAEEPRAAVPDLPSPAWIPERPAGGGASAAELLQ